MFSGGGIDLNGPQLAEFALLFLAVREHETPGVKGGFFGLAIFGFTSPQKALRVFEKSFSALSCSGSSL